MASLSVVLNGRQKRKRDGLDSISHAVFKYWGCVCFSFVHKKWKRSHSFFFTNVVWEPPSLGPWPCIHGWRDFLPVVRSLYDSILNICYYIMRIINISISTLIRSWCFSHGFFDGNRNFWLIVRKEKEPIESFSKWRYLLLVRHWCLLNSVCSKISFTPKP